MKEGTILQDRYALIRRIGRGATADTWLADDRACGRQVVVKLLSLGLMDEWKAFELLEREAGVLKSMHHDGIPEYVDYFRSGAGERTRFALVQEHVQGVTLAEKVESGWRGTEEEIAGITIRLLRIVGYIHSLRPPVIHRDINPRNVIIRDDGSVFLVDFGGVQDVARTSAASEVTVIGTPGYTPMEQFVGRATVRSDLYGCAATLLFLLTHRNPQDLPVRDMKIDVSSVVELSPGMTAVLGSWLEPDETRRTLSIEDAIACLEGRPAGHGSPTRAPGGRPPPSSRAAPAVHGSPTRAPGGAAALLRAFETAVTQRIPEAAEEEEDDEGFAVVPADLTPPHYSHIKVEVKGDEAVTITIPSRGERGSSPVAAGFSVFWLGFVAFWTGATIVMGAWPMALFSIPFWLVGFGLVGGMLKGALGKTVLRLEARSGLTFERKFISNRTVTVPFDEVGRLGITETGTINHQPVTALEMEVGARRFTFGQNLSTAEKKWVRRNFNALVRTMDTPKG